MFGGGLSEVGPAELAAAREGKLPPGLHLSDLSDFLTGLHGAGGNVLGVIHALGYTRGLLNALRYAERRRLRALAGAAARGLRSVSGGEGGQSGLARAEGRAAAASADLLCWVVLPCLALASLPYHLVVRPAARQADLVAVLLFLLALLLGAIYAV